MKKYFLYVFLALNTIALIVFWWSYSGRLMDTNPLLALGRLSGLLLSFAALLQVFLIGRVAWVERSFGFDRLVKLHRVVGYSIAAFLLAHPILLSLAYGKMTGKSFWTQTLAFVSNFEDVFAATVAFFLFISVIVLSIAIVRKKLSYETWYVTHLFVYAAIALAFSHQTAIGGDLRRQPFLIYWYALHIFTFGNLLLFRFAKPAYQFFKYRFTVRSVEAESGEANSVYIEGKNLADFKFKSGQFLKLRFLAKKIWREEHPFSISSAPNGEYVRVTIKELGDFTSEVGNILPGTKVLIDGPHGLFTSEESKKDKTLFIAGGVGITPIFPLLSEFREKGKDVALIFCNKNVAGTIFKKEIDELSAKYNFPVYYVMSDDPSWTGEKGRLDAAKIARLVPDINKREAYVCGPAPMMKSALKNLTALGVSENDLHYEEFAY